MLESPVLTFNPLQDWFSVPATLIPKSQLNLENDGVELFLFGCGWSWGTIQDPGSNKCFWRCKMTRFLLLFFFSRPILFWSLESDIEGLSLSRPSGEGESKVRGVLRTREIIHITLSSWQIPFFLSLVRNRFLLTQTCTYLISGLAGSSSFFPSDLVWHDWSSIDMNWRDEIFLRVPGDL